MINFYELLFLYAHNKMYFQQLNLTFISLSYIYSIKKEKEDTFYYKYILNYIIIYVGSNILSLYMLYYLH